MHDEFVEDLSRRLGLLVSKVEHWRQRGLAGIDAGLREHTTIRRNANSPRHIAALAS